MAKTTKTAKTTTKKSTAKKSTTARKAAGKKSTVKKTAKVIDLKSKKEMEVPGMRTEAIKRLTDAGFKRWQKGDHDRLYISAARLGLKMDEDGVSFMGDPIDQKEGQRMKAAKTYMDVKTGEVFSGNDTLEAAASALVSKLLSINEVKSVTV